MKKVITHDELLNQAISPGARSFDQVGKVSDASVFKHTQKHWKEWVDLLEKAGARSWTYPELVTYLKKKHRLTPWWQQSVALGFLIATGQRQVGQDQRGKYMATATKSLSVPLGQAWTFLISRQGLEIWLKPMIELSVQPQVQFETEDGYFGEVRTVAKNRRARLFWNSTEWEKHTVVELMVVARPKGRSILIFNHTGIHNQKTLSALRKRWRAAADAIGESLVGRALPSTSQRGRK